MDLIAEFNHRMKVFHDIVGCAFDVYNAFKPGLTEYPYQYGLRHLLVKLGYDARKEHFLPIYLFGEKLEESYRLDLVVVRPNEGDIIIECKAMKCIIDEHREQLKNYMLLTQCPYGMLINFSKSYKVYSETYEYHADTHTVGRMNTSYMGMMYEMTEKPWQKSLDAMSGCTLKTSEKEFPSKLFPSESAKSISGISRPYFSSEMNEKEPD